MLKISLINFLSFLVLLGIIPLITLFIQFILVGVHGWKNHYVHCQPYTPNIAVIVPVWNEEDVIASSIDSLMQLDYPRDHLRVYAVDDVSTDGTPKILQQKAEQYPGVVFNLRRPEKIDFGKAAVINHGLNIILNEPWAEAIMIMDADVMLEPDCLSKMARHLADPEINAVTAYIKEGQVPGNLLSHYIGFEYIVAQAATRRAQNVLGTLACLAGGAQLHRRSNLVELGGRVDTSTLAEDTFTTFATQINNHRVVFDGNAVAIAEEPERIYDLWKQRFRWAEGNVQITRHFKKLWFHPHAPGGLGSIFFGLIWFSTMVMPITMIVTSISLNILFFLQGGLSWELFRMFTLISMISYLFTTIFALCIDPQTAKRVWFAGFMFPGVLSLFNMFIAVLPNQVEHLVAFLFNIHGWTVDNSYLLIWLNSWISLCMLFAWCVYRLDRARIPSKLSNFLLLLVGFGPLLCVVTLIAYITQLTQHELKWEKTIKRGKVKPIRTHNRPRYNFSEALALDKKEELRILGCEIILLGALLMLSFLYTYYGIS